MAHYIRVDEKNRVIHGFSTAFETPLETDICILEDTVLEVTGIEIIPKLPTSLEGVSPLSEEVEEPTKEGELTNDNPLEVEYDKVESLITHVECPRQFMINGVENPPLTNELGVYLYKYIDNKVAERTEEEISEDISAIPPKEDNSLDIENYLLDFEFRLSMLELGGGV